MTITRRNVLLTGLFAAAGTALHSKRSVAQTPFSPVPAGWRTFDVVTRLEIPTLGSPARAWIPLPSVTESEWFKPITNHATSNGQHSIWRDPVYGTSLVHTEWSGNEPIATIEVTSRAMTRDRSTDFSRSSLAEKLPDAVHKLYTASNDHVPVHGIVKQVSDGIISSAGARLPVEKILAVYNWVVDNTYREAKVRGCGTGDIVAMLKSGNFGGKCADLNALFVALVRAQGIPARDIYGIRVAPSSFGYKSLGANSTTITKAQHCRAEVFLSGYGWVPMDPADVRKVILEEPPGNLAIDDQRVAAAKKTLFGSWETNWIAYNTADQVALPGAKAAKPTFLMYPEAETVAGRLDCLDPDTFKYTITSAEVTT